MNFKLRIKYRKGAYLPVLLLASTLFLAYATALITFAVANVRTADLHNKKITASSIAEAGVNYYMWHLAHNDGDFCDGQACTGSAPYGPFTHNYTDQSGKVLGSYDLFITPPATGEATTTVKSVGKVNGISPQKTIVAEISMPFFSKYTMLTNGTQLWVGPNEKITGTLHINNSGVYNEGEITGDASSTESTYSSWNWGTQPGIAGPGIFGGDKLYPVPPIDFNQVTVDIANLKTKSQDANGAYYGSSRQKGYHVTLRANDYSVATVRTYDSTGLNITREDTSRTYTYPSNGILFFQDNIWIEGTVQDKKITVVAADPAESGSQMKRIVIPNPVKYTYYNGRDKIGLITQTDILLTRNAPSNMEIDAAMIARDGVIRINSYCSPSATCLSDQKNYIKVYGSMAHNSGLDWTWDYGGGKWSGYKTTETVIDPYNVINPPPEFPKTGSYSILSWREE